VTEDRGEHSAVILLVEDDPGDQELTKRALEEGRFRNDLYIVENGREALDYLYREGKYEDPASSPTPDLILLDLNMPVLGGKEVLEKLQHHPDFRQMVVIVLTTSNQETDIVRSYNLGVKSFITKPVDFNQFVQIVREVQKYWFQIVVLPPTQRCKGDG